MIDFVGDSSWQPVAIPKWSLGGFGTDTATVAFSGSRDLLEKFRGTLTDWSTLKKFVLDNVEQWPANDSAWLERAVDSGGSENFPRIELQYIGFRDGKIPDPKFDDTTSDQSAQGSGTDTGSGLNVTGTIQYRASRTKWTWFATQEPPDTAPSPYNTVRKQINPFTTITKYSITDSATQRPINSIPFSAFTAVFNSLAAVERVTDYSRELIVPGKLWACSSTVDYVLA